MSRQRANHRRQPLASRARAPKTPFHDNNNGDDDDNRDQLKAITFTRRDASKEEEKKSVYKYKESRTFAVATDLANQRF